MHSDFISEDYLGKLVVVKMDFVNLNKKIVSSIENYGLISEISMEDGIIVKSELDGEEFSLPYDFKSLKKPENDIYEIEINKCKVCGIDFIAFYELPIDKAF